MAAPVFDIGDDVILTAVFTVAGVNTDPTAASITVIDPSGTETIVTPSKQSTGIYTGVFSPTVDGDHWYRGVGTGPAKAAGESVFHVRKRRVT